jgi:hypothetical protein
VRTTRVSVALVVLAGALAAALYLGRRDVGVTETRPLKGDNAGYLVAGKSGIVHVRVLRHPAWETPVAVVVALGGLAVAIHTVRVGRPLR